MNGNHSMFESLESRTLFSAASLAADRLAVQAAVLQEATQANANASTLLADRQAVVQYDISGNSTIGPLVAQFKSDAAASALTLQSDRLTQASNVDAAQAVALTAKAAVIADVGTDAEAGALATFYTDKAAVQQAFINGLNQRITDRNAEYATLFSDAQAIESALSGSGLSDAAQAAVTQYTGDKLSALTSLTTDLQGVISARTTLMTALNDAA
ncbi:MAG TPA: hypothetical protein VMD30_06330 [Tepidisphaeraceae bacterium]|nr:hypothetical protein [Tepidisphaeraceae bacterium]